MDSWRSLPSRYRKLFGHPYVLCIVLILEDALSVLDNFSGMHPAERLVTIAEYMDPYDPSRPPSPGDRDGRRLERIACSFWNFWVRRLHVEERVRPIVFDDSRRSPQLQAADFYAHASYRVMARPHLPVRFVGLPDVSPSPPFPPTIYPVLRDFLRPPLPPHVQPPHYYGVASDDDLKRLFPLFDRVIEEIEDDGSGAELEALILELEERDRRKFQGDE
jgi:hypothetical protein